MKKKYWTLLFAVILIGELIGIQLQNEQVQFVFKPLIIPVIIGYLVSGAGSLTKGLNKWILIALLFSFLGDFLLMFQEKNSLFFLLGLSVFLLAHIFYIVFFHQVRIRENIKSNPWLLLIVVIYYAVLMSLLTPHFDNPEFHKMKLPVRIYAVVISFMFLLAMHMLYIKNRTAGKWMMAGALLFVISDSLLAINKFYQPFEAAGVLIMLTYGLAQLFLVEGAIRYIRSVNSN